MVRSRYRDSLQRFRLERNRGPLLLQDQARALVPDSGNVAILEDDGTLTTQVNSFDLRGKSILLAPGYASTYAVTVQDRDFAAGTGTRIFLSDDDSGSVPLFPAFPFFGKSYSSVYVNSDGNLTFDASDRASTARDLGRFAWGPPRIGPLFTDLDPSNPNSGPVFYRRDSDGIVFVWDGVPKWIENSAPLQMSTFSVKLFDNGNIEFDFGASVNAPDVIVGISPGANSEGISAIDFTSGQTIGNLSGTIVEIFSLNAQLSETAIARKFYQNHPDEFDQLVVFLTFPFDLQNAFSYELNITNDVQGIGLEILDSSSDFGSGGRLKSFVMMGHLGQFQTNPDVDVLRTYNSLEVITHEVAHRWLAFPFLREDGFNSISLLHSDDLSHWSFFFNADASLMEGNQILDRGETLDVQRFVTSEVTNKLSALDRYLIGIEDPKDVPPMFYVKNPTGTSANSNRLPQDRPTVFGGTRSDFTIDSLVAANGARVPSVFQSQKVHRIAFILVSNATYPATAERVSTLQTLHDAWVPYFSQVTAGQAWAITTLQSSPGTTPSKIYYPYFNGDSTRYTGFAVANWGSSAADVLFRSLDNAGTETSTPAGIINPRMITIPPGGQIAMLGEQIHAIPLDKPRDGWVIAESSSSQTTGFFLAGDVNETFLDGASVGNKTSTWLCFTRVFGSTGTFKNLINIANPNAVAARLTATLYKPDGQQQGPAVDLTLNPRARVAQDLSTLFPTTDSSFAGYITVSSDVGVIGYESFEGASTTYALPAQPAATATTLYSAQFASGAAGTIRYFTDLNLINTATDPRTVRIALIGDDGMPVFPVPAEYTLKPGEQRLVRGEALFSLLDAALAPDIVQGTLVVTTGGAGVLGDVTFGDPIAGRFMAGLPLDGAPATDMILSQVAQGSQGNSKAYFTGVAVHNPNPNQVTVTIDVFSEGGQPTGHRIIVLRPGERLADTLPGLVGLNRQIRGYMRLTSNGGPIIAFELFGEASAVDFLAAVPPQRITP